MNTALVQNLKDIITHAIIHTPDRKALVIYDRSSELSSLLADGYAQAMPDATMIDFANTDPNDIRAIIDTLAPKDLVVLVQSSSFRLNDFRFRLELFNRDLAVIEHPHLSRMTGEECNTYIDSLEYDPAYYRGLGAKLKERIDKAKRIVVSSSDAELVYECDFETAKLNVGDYTGMKNRGGQFPIGEVFTEPVNLEGVNGTVKLFAYADANFHVQISKEPITVVIEKGIIVDAPGAPEGFVAVLDQIRADEQLRIRELGFGMNRAMTRTRVLNDIGSYERMCGIHLSIGHKHTIYAKAGLPKRSSKYHVDVFVDTQRVMIDGETVYENGTYVI